MKLRSETIRILELLLSADCGIATCSAAEELGVGMQNMRKRMLYLYGNNLASREEYRKMSPANHPRGGNATAHKYSITDYGRQELMAYKAKAKARARPKTSKKHLRIVNSVFALGQL
jgi:predicted ArsR family transcriptional regulator